MFYKLLASIAIASLPVMAHAQIYSYASASSNSGGNAAGPGGRVETGGASASVSTSNIDGTSGSSVYIKTNANGAVHEESYTTPSGDVSVSVQSTPKETVIEAREGTAPAVKKIIPASPEPVQEKSAIGTRAKAAALPSLVPAVPSVASVASASVPQEQGLGLGARIALSIRSFFAGLFSWLK